MKKVVVCCFCFLFLVSCFFVSCGTKNDVVRENVKQSLEQFEKVESITGNDKNQPANPSVSSDDTNVGNSGTPATSQGAGDSFVSEGHSDLSPEKPHQNLAQRGDDSDDRNSLLLEIGDEISIESETKTSNNKVKVVLLICRRDRIVKKRVTYEFEINGEINVGKVKFDDTGKQYLCSLYRNPNRWQFGLYVGIGGQSFLDRGVLTRGCKMKIEKENISISH
jgi:hypothetical protein